MPEIYLPAAPEGLYEHTAKRGEDFLLGLRPPRTLNTVMAANRLSSAATGTGFQPVQAPAPALQPVPDAATQGGQVVSTRAGLMRIPWPQPAAPQPVPILPAPGESLASQVAQARVTNAPVDLGGGMAQYGPRIRGGVVADTGAPTTIGIPQAGPVSQGLLQPVPDSQFKPATGQDLTKYAGSAKPMPAITPAMVAPQTRPAPLAPAVSLPVAPQTATPRPNITPGVSGEGLPTGEPTVQMPGLPAGSKTTPGGVPTPISPAEKLSYTKAKTNQRGAAAVSPEDQAVIDRVEGYPAQVAAQREAKAAQTRADAKALTLSREDVTRADQEVRDLKAHLKAVNDETYNGPDTPEGVQTQLDAATVKRDALVASRRSALGAGGELGAGNVDIRGMAPMVRPPLTPAQEKALPSLSMAQAKYEENDITDLLYGKKIINPLGEEERVPGFLKITQRQKRDSQGQPIFTGKSLDNPTGKPAMEDVIAPATAEILDKVKAAMVERLARDKKFGKVAEAEATYAMVRWMVQAENNNASFGDAIKEWKSKNAAAWKKYAPAVAATPDNVPQPEGSVATGPVGPQGRNVGPNGEPIQALGTTGVQNRYNQPVVKPNDARHGYVAPAPSVTETPKTVDVTPAAATAPVAPTPGARITPEIVAAYRRLYGDDKATVRKAMLKGNWRLE